MEAVKCYTIPALAEATGVSERSLYTWRHKGWLKPYAVAGVRHYYRMEEFDAAARQSAQESLKQARESAMPQDDPKSYDEVINRINQKHNGLTPLRVRDRRTKRGEGKAMGN